MTTELTPAVQDAAYRLGWRVAAVLGGNPDKTHIVLSDAFPFILDGFDAFTPEAEAERVEAVREASIQPPTPNRLWSNLREALMIFAGLYTLAWGLALFMP